MLIKTLEEKSGKKIRVIMNPTIGIPPVSDAEADKRIETMLWTVRNMSDLKGNSEYRIFESLMYESLNCSFDWNYPNLKDSGINFSDVYYFFMGERKECDKFSAYTIRNDEVIYPMPKTQEILNVYPFKNRYEKMFEVMLKKKNYAHRVFLDIEDVYGGSSNISREQKELDKEILERLKDIAYGFDGHRYEN